ncbi:hypothetical protein [Thiomicrospira sp.]|uniref:hypothetical protein n=1 Tax=Thiomicrospira sp. TaxID=935 RepID=UPI002F93DDBC
MSNTINPAMQSLAMSAMPQQNQASQQAENRVSDRATSEVSSAGNTTVTLSSQAQAAGNDYMDLAASQTVNQNNPVQDQNTNANDTSNGLTYAANLQAQANYNAQQLSQADSAETPNPSA